MIERAGVNIAKRWDVTAGYIGCREGGERERETDIQTETE